MGKLDQSGWPRWLVRWMRRIRALPARFGEWPSQRANLGAGNAWKLGWSAFRHPVGDRHARPGPGLTLPLPGLAHPFVIRQGTSDIPLVRQIFVQREYEWLQRLGNVETIIDAGANIGGSAVFFLNMFPRCRVFAVEPSPDNFTVLERNLAPYGSRARCIQAALWPDNTTLRLIRGRFRDGLEWSTQVEPATPGEPGARGMTVPQLMIEAGFSRVDLLKIDIEGAEQSVLTGDTTWLQHVANLCVELHDAQARAALLQALRDVDYAIEDQAETTLVENIRPKAS